MWHVLEIMNALEGAGATTNAKLVSKQLPPMLAAQASSVTALEMERREGSTGSMPPMSPHLVAPVTRQRAASKTDMVEELQGIFNLFDRDGNGTIDIDELQVLMKKLGYQPKEEKLKEIIKEVDHNSDGELQFGEFCLFIKKIKEGGIHGGGYQEALATQIDELSGSADGYVGAEDIKMMMQVFAETTGQTISEEDIQDILVLGHSAGHQVTAHHCHHRRLPHLHLHLLSSVSSSATRGSPRRLWRMQSCWTRRRVTSRRGRSARPSRVARRRSPTSAASSRRPSSWRCRRSSRGRRCLRMSDNATCRGASGVFRTGTCVGGRC